MGRFEVGSAITFMFGGRDVEGLIVEDRGPLASGGQHLYRIATTGASGVLESFELPEYDLGLQLARRALFAEMANRAVQMWVGMPLGGVLDQVTGYQSLEKALFEAFCAVGDRVGREVKALAGALHRDGNAITGSRSPVVATAQALALRIGERARESGIEHLHEAIEESLWEAARAERDRLLQNSRDLGWRDVERAMLSTDARGGETSFLALIAGDPLKSAA